MSIKIMSQVWENEELSTTDKMVLLSLADHADDEGVCYPSISRLMRRTSLKERTVQTAIRRLTESGHLRVELNAGKRGANLYRINATPAADAPPQDMPPAADAPPPPHMTAQTPAADAPESSRTVIKPSVHFGAFWEQWPLRKVNRKKAEVAFNRLSKHDQAEATTKARSWAARWKATYPGASDVHPTTYLNGKRWEDEFQGPPENVSQIDRWRKLQAKG